MNGVWPEAPEGWGVRPQGKRQGRHSRSVEGEELHLKYMPETRCQRRSALEGRSRLKPPGEDGLELDREDLHPACDAARASATRARGEQHRTPEKDSVKHPRRNARAPRAPAAPGSKAMMAIPSQPLCRLPRAPFSSATACEPSTLPPFFPQTLRGTSLSYK